MLAYKAYKEQTDLNRDKARIVCSSATCSTGTSRYCDLSASRARRYSAADRVLSRTLVESGLLELGRKVQSTAVRLPLDSNL